MATSLSTKGGDMAMDQDDPRGSLSTVGAPPSSGTWLTVAQANRNCADMGCEKLVLALQFRDAGLDDTAFDMLEYAEFEAQQNSAAHIRRYSALPDLAKACIDYLVQHECDFGTAFSLFLLGELDQWKQKDIWDLSKYNPTLCNMNGQPQGHYLQEDSTGSTFIKDPLTVYPRRIWDLRSHRVIPFEWYMNIGVISPVYGEFELQEGRNTGIVAISHSWTNDMKGVLTPVNREEWPVPLPAGITLERLREQLWEQGARYCWLDVLCLRQQSDDTDKEKLRTEEWKIDVPTIGNVYKHAEKLVRYFNGLGRPFQPLGWEDNRHWLKRAWTLQEMIPEEDTVTGGVIKDQNPLESKIGNGNETLREVIDNLARTIGRHEDFASPPNILRLVEEMKRRSATKDLDKIGGIMYLLLTGQHQGQLLPIYDQNSSPETAWGRAIGTMVQASMEEGVDGMIDTNAAVWSLLTQYPYPSAGHWFPSWNQAIKFPEEVLREEQIDPGTAHSNTCLRFSGGSWFEIYRNCHVIPTGSGAGQKTLVYGNSNSKELEDRLAISASGAMIENGQYLVISMSMDGAYNEGDGSQYLVVCRETSELEGVEGTYVIRARKVGVLAITPTELKLLEASEDFDGTIDDNIKFSIE